MQQCDGRSGGICTNGATWKQSVYANNAGSGRMLLSSFWCDEHAEKIGARRMLNHQPPAVMQRLEPDAVEGKPHG